jgi:hypothetical protein
MAEASAADRPPSSEGKSHLRYGCEDRETDEANRGFIASEGN